MRLLIVGGLQGQIGLATKIAMDKGAKVTHATDIEQALASLRGGVGADLVFCDVALDIGSLVRGLSAERICTPVVACGVGTDTSRAVAAIRAGAKEYLPLPADPELIAAVLAAVADESHQLVHEDEAMDAVLSLADQIAGSEASILITGESGTGKEVLARYVHRKSQRSDKPFISVNCAAIPENLLESELFGHEKGAFTGAIARRIGKFEEANGGTLLLDEISEMDARLQAKLLRAIQEKEIRQVGSTKRTNINVRILAATNRDLEMAVAQGTFRRDLYFRLNVLNLRIPPLRERRQDIPVLAAYFLEQMARDFGQERTLSDDAMKALLAYDWPGNVRELENCLQRACAMNSGPEIQVLDLPSTMHGGNGHAAVETDGSAKIIPISELERKTILNTITQLNGDKLLAARLLGIGKTTLYRKLKEYEFQA